MVRQSTLPKLLTSVTILGLAGCPGAVNQPGTAVTFVPIQVDPLQEDSAGPVRCDIGDIDRDGRLDVVSAWNDSQPVQIHFQTGRVDGIPTFDTITIGGAAPIATTAALKVVDLNQDKRLDVVVVAGDTGFLPPEGSQLLGAIVLFIAPEDPHDPLAWQEVALSNGFIGTDDPGYVDMAVANVDGMNGPDLIVAVNETAPDPDTASKSILLWANPGPDLVADGNAWNFARIHRDAPAVKACNLIDIDGDGDLDVVATYPEAKSFNIRWLINPLVPDGTAAAVGTFWETRVVGQVSPGADTIDIGDIDADGLDDVVVRSENGLVIQWFKGPADPVTQTFPWDVFTLAQFKELPPTAVALGDINGDGALDCVAAAEGALRWFTPLGGSTLDQWIENGVATDIPAGTSASQGTTGIPSAIPAIQVVDLDGDGRQDIIAPFDRDGLSRDALFLFLNRLSPAGAR